MYFPLIHKIPETGWETSIYNTRHAPCGTEGADFPLANRFTTAFHTPIV